MKNKNKHKLKNTLQKIMAITMVVAILSTLLLLPANASEETEETCTISGTWRFNDVLSIFNYNSEHKMLSALFNYSVKAVIDEEVVEAEYSAMGVGFLENSSETFCLAYIILGEPAYSVWNNQDGWVKEEGLELEFFKTIYIETEQEVSKEFYTWLTKNAKRIDVEVKPSSYTSTIIQGASGILGGIGKGAVNFFESIFLDDKGGISTLGIYCLCFVGIGMAIGIMRWIRKKCG